MLNEIQKSIIIAALELEISSAKRQAKMSKRPEFTELYDKRVRDAEATMDHIKSIKPTK